MLYLGLQVPEELTNERVTHCPLIQIIPRSLNDPFVQSAMLAFSDYTHLLFTSKSSVTLFFEYASHFDISMESIQSKTIIVVGQKTASKLQDFGVIPQAIAEEETAEGVTKLLQEMSLEQANFFWPHSARSRSIISNWLTTNGIRHCSCIFYDTIYIKPEALPDLNSFEEIMFTSPSTVDAFIACYGRLPTNKKLSCKGPVTEAYLRCQISGVNPK